MKIVWIDDDWFVIEPLVEPLERDGHQVDRLRTVSEALETVNAWRDCDLLVLDLILPPGNGPMFGLYPGIPLLAELRDRYHVTAPALILSVVDASKVEVDRERLKIVGYLRKPVLPSQLKQTVEAALETSKAGVAVA